MRDNEKYLKEAQAQMSEFEAYLDPERLRDACMALDNVILAKEDAATRSPLRRNSLLLWLKLLNLLDGYLDPKFNVDDVPVSAVQPPPTSTGISFPPGVDPALIDDPKARAAYKEAIAANLAKMAAYRLQAGLHRMNERIPPRVEAFSYELRTHRLLMTKESLNRRSTN